MLPGERTLGHYRLLQRIGSGGMGEVYLAEDTRIAQRQVAIKVVRAESDPYPDPVALQDATRLFQREMRAIIMLDHPYILPLFDFGEVKTDNITTIYMVMPFRQEGSLTDWLQKRENVEKLTASQIAHFIELAADALQHAHDHNLVHQDIKPSNFLIRNRSNNKLPDLLLTDFGIAKINSATATASQNIRGTPAFMAPEQWEGNPEPATDQYALAIMTYLLLTGRTPFTGRMEQVMRQHFMTQPQPPSSHNPDIPPALDAIILRALEKSPDKRFPSIIEFAQAFQQACHLIDKQNTETAISNIEEGSSAPEKDSEVQEENPSNNSASLPPIIEESPSNNSMPLPSMIYTAQSGELPPTVVAPQIDLSAIKDDTILGSEIPNASQGTAPHEPISGANKSTKSAKRPHWKIPMLIGLILLIIIPSITGLDAYQKHVSQMNATATANADHATSIAAIATANVSATEQVYAGATATVQAYKTALSGNSKLAFVDPLSTENHWHASPLNNTGGNCQFTRGSYHVNQSPKQYLMECDADGTFSNFALEVQMTIIQGDCDGLVFRDNSSTGKGYYFQTCQDGSYRIVKYISNSGTDAKTMQDSNSSSITTGLNQQNTIAVIARGNTLTFYINQQQIDQEQDSSYSDGIIGLTANPQAGNATEVAYSNARVWTF